MLWRHFLKQATLFLELVFRLCQVDRNYPVKPPCVDMGTEYKERELATLTKMGMNSVRLSVEGARHSNRTLSTLQSHWAKAHQSILSLNNELVTKWQYNKHHIWKNTLQHNSAKYNAKQTCWKKNNDGKWQGQVRLVATEPVSPRRHTMGEAGVWMLLPYSADPKTKA